HDRTRLPDGSYTQWKSPAGTPLHLAAAFPRWGWSDLAYALVPNGRFLDYKVAPTFQAAKPQGVPKTSYIHVEYDAGNATGFVAPEGADPSADLAGWLKTTDAGEPGGSAGQTVLNQLIDFHSTSGITAGSSKPAPLLIENGWTDDLFPAEQALRAYNRLRAVSTAAPVSLL